MPRELILDTTLHPFTIESNSLTHMPRFSNLLCAAESLIQLEGGKVVNTQTQEVWNYLTCMVMCGARQGTEPYGTSIWLDQMKHDMER